MQSEKEFAIKADLPGVPKEAVKVQVDGDVLSLEVEQKKEEEKKEEKEGVLYHR